MSEIKILTLPIRKQWFDMIKSGVKKEEYRDLKPFYMSRLIEQDPNSGSLCARKSDLIYNLMRLGQNKNFHAPALLYKKGYRLKDFDFVKFTNGYGNSVPSIICEVKKIVIRSGKSDWGARPNVHYFVIVLGKVSDSIEVLNEQ
jgi:hypothetical protein